MTTESKALGRRNTVLASVIGSVLASYAGGALALEWEFENGARLNWNTTLSVGSSWRSEDPSRALYTHADGSLLGKYNGNILPGEALPKGNGTAGNWAGGEATLNYDKGDRFSTPFKLISDVEFKKGSFGGLLRIKAWYDQALEDETVRLGNQANSFNGGRPPLGPTLPNCFLGAPAGLANCIPLSSPGNNVWPRGELSDKGFEDEQKFSNVYLLDAYVYGSIPVGDSDLQLRLGNQVINWGESVFIQGVNQINPIDVPAARRAGAELKEILLPVWAAYINWGFNFGSLEAFYQLQWNNTSIDGCGTYWAQTAGLISTDPGPCNAATATGNILGTAIPGPALTAQFGSTPFLQSTGLYVPLFKGKDASDSGQFGLAFRFPVDAIDTEIGLYYMNIHSRLPVISSIAGTSPNDLSETEKAVLSGAGIYGSDAVGGYYSVGTTNFRSPLPHHVFVAALAGQQALGQPIVLKPAGSYWEYPEDIQILGASAATNLFGWSVSSELSYHKDVPVQVNGNDLLAGGLLLIGPHREDSIDAYFEGTGAYLRGWDKFDKTQFQVNTVKTFSNILGAGNMLLIGEVGFQWNDVPDHTKDNVRYGRGFMWGYGSSPAYGVGALEPLQGNTCSPTYTGLPVPVPSALYNPSPRGCKNGGYVTDYAWGYRIRASADYLNVFGSGVTVTPSVFWSHDVDGISMDPAFIEDRQVLGLGVKFVYNKKYTLDFNWVDYANEGYDPLQDRDYYSAAFSVTF